MSQSRIKILLAFFALLTISVSCKKQFSTDTPLPPVYTPSIILGSDNQTVYAYDVATGAKSWEFFVNDQIISSPLLYNEMVYISTLQGDLWKLDAKTGKMKKHVFFQGFRGTPIADDNLIYLPTVFDSLLVIDTGTFVVKWRFGGGGAAGFESSPVIANGQVIIGDDNKRVYCLDKTLGTLTWTLDTSIIHGKFISSPAVCGPFIYVGNTDSTMYCINVSSVGPKGVLRWLHKTGGAVVSSPIAYGGSCIFGCEDFKVYCIDTASDSIRWVDSTGDRITASPYAYNQVIYIPSYDYKLYAINIVNGAIKWSFSSQALIKSSPVCYAGTVYVGSYDQYLYALDTAHGTVKWRQNINGQIECSPVINDLTGNSYNSAISGYTN